jgi:hypothetical protein
LGILDQIRIGLESILLRMVFLLFRSAPIFLLSRAAKLEIDRPCRLMLAILLFPACINVMSCIFPTLILVLVLGQVPIKPTGHTNPSVGDAFSPFLREVKSSMAASPIRREARLLGSL